MSHTLQLQAILTCTAILTSAMLSNVTIAQHIQPMETYREVSVELFMYDSFWRESDHRFVQEESSDSGVFEQDIAAETSTVFQACSGAAFQESDVSAFSIETMMLVEAEGIDYDDGQADSYSVSTMETTFEVTDGIRFDFNAIYDTFVDTDSTNASVLIQLIGPDGFIFFDYVDGNFSKDIAVQGWLKKGDYTLQLEARSSVNASLYSDPHDEPETSSALLQAVFTPYCPGDYDMDGDVDANDAQLFRENWLTQEPESDVDGNGVVNVRDALLFRIAWKMGC